MVSKYDDDDDADVPAKEPYRKRKATKEVEKAADSKASCKPAKPVYFTHKLKEMLDLRCSSFLIWNPSGEKILLNVNEMERTEIFRRFFKHNSATSFTRQLNYFGFERQKPNAREQATFGKASCEVLFHPSGNFTRDGQKIDLIERKTRNLKEKMKASCANQGKRKRKRSQAALGRPPKEHRRTTFSKNQTHGQMTIGSRAFATITQALHTKFVAEEEALTLLHFARTFGKVEDKSPPIGSDNDSDNDQERDTTSNTPTQPIISVTRVNAGKLSPAHTFIVGKQSRKQPMFRATNNKSLGHQHQHDPSTQEQEAPYC